MSIALITGATGFVGSHVAEAMAKRGTTVRAVCRPSSDTRLLEELKADIVIGDLADTEAMAKALAGVDVVVHCAAKVGDWGPAEDYRRVNVAGLKGLLDAARQNPLKRFVHVSSLGVYEARHHYGTDEAEPLPDQHIDGYTQSKVESERLALDYVRQFQLPITILRPGFIYGPRDRTVLPRLAERLKKKDIIYIARGRYAMNTTYVGNLVEAILLAVDHPDAVGELFNITDGELVTKRRFFETIADGLNLPRPKMSIPLGLARFLARWRESVYRRKNKPYPPRITHGTLKFAGLNLDFSIAKARTQLGYNPQIGFEAGMAEALNWYRNRPNPSEASS